MLTPRLLVRYLRLAAGVCGAGLIILLLGPFQGLESAFGLTDKEAHAATFFCVTAGLFCIAPKWRRTDLGLMVLGFGLAIEFLQGLTGRSMSISDFLADAVGVGAALVPGFIERLRHQVRKYPDVDFRTLRVLDRRRARSLTSGSKAVPAGSRNAGGAVRRV